MKLAEKRQQYYLTRSLVISGLIPFSKGINPKLNLTARREFELAYLEAAI